MKPAPAAAEDSTVVAWHLRPSADALAHFRASATGLTSAEAARRLATDGPNVLTEMKSVSALQIALGQFKSLVIWILIAAGAISGVLGDRIDALAIFAVVLLNASIGFYQELTAEKSITALRELAAPHAKVLRNGQVAEIPAADVVTGDILALEAGDLVAGVNDTPVSTLAEMYRQLWSQGEAGVDVLLNLRRDGEDIDVTVHSESRYRFMERRRNH